MVVFQEEMYQAWKIRKIQSNRHIVYPGSCLSSPIFFKDASATKGIESDGHLDLPIASGMVASDPEAPRQVKSKPNSAFGQDSAHGEGKIDTSVISDVTKESRPRSPLPASPAGKIPLKRPQTPMQGIFKPQSTND